MTLLSKHQNIGDDFLQILWPSYNTFTLGSEECYLLESPKFWVSMANTFFCVCFLPECFLAVSNIRPYLKSNRHYSNDLNQQYYLDSSEVVLGEHDFGSDEDCDSFGFCSAPIIRRQINVDRDVIIHENFDKRGNLEYDIALIRIEEAVTLHQENEFKSSISPICLPWNINLDYETQDGQIATGAGWGRTVGRATKNSQRNLLNNNINVNKLQVLGLPIANKKCKNIDPEIQLCAGGEAGKQHKRCFTEIKNF